MIEDGAIIAEDVKIGYYSIIKSGAKIGKGSIIGDFCYIDSGVSIGNNNVVGTAVHIKGNVQIGDSNYISDNTIIGLFGKHIGYHFYQGKVIIGNNNFIGNGCSIDCGNNYLSMEKPELLRYSLIDLNQDKELEDTTIIGDRCYILNGVTDNKLLTKEIEKFSIQKSDLAALNFLLRIRDEKEEVEEKDISIILRILLLAFGLLCGILIVTLLIRVGGR